jgi:autotransporter-associated beta strand protein
MKKPTLNSLQFVSLGVGLSAALLGSYNAEGAVLYFDPNGANPVTAGTYTWDTTSLEWSTSSALTGSLVAWNSTDAANFCAGSFTGNITVMVNSAINVAGIFDGNLTPPGCNLTLAGTGSLAYNNASGSPQALGDGGSDGNSVTMNVPITDGPNGACGIQIEQDGVNSIYMYAANTFSGNVTIGPSATGININNNNSFGVNNSSQTIANSSSATRAISMPLAAQTGPITLNQKWSLWNGNLTIAGVQAYPLTLAGSMSIVAGGTSTITVQPTTDVGAGTPTVYITGSISGATGSLTKAGPANLVLSGANTYAGKTTVSAGVLQLGAANTIATSSGIVLAGGTLNGGGFNHANTGTLQMTASSTLDFGGGNMSFADSHSLAWTGTLNLADWTQTGSGDFGSQLQVGTSASGLTSGQLGEIEFDGNAGTLGDAAIDANGFVYMVPEPSTLALSLLGGLGMLCFRRRTA